MALVRVTRGTLLMAAASVARLRAMRAVPAPLPVVQTAPLEKAIPRPGVVAVAEMGQVQLLEA